MTAPLPCRKPRYIIIRDEAVEVLQRRHAGRNPEQPRLFPSPRGGRWVETSLSHKFVRLRRRAGLDGADNRGEKIVLYSLRHTRLTEAAGRDELGFYDVKLMVGHHTSEMARRSVKIPPLDTANRAVEAAGGAVRSRPAPPRPHPGRSPEHFLNEPMAEAASFPSLMARRK